MNNIKFYASQGVWVNCYRIHQNHWILSIHSNFTNKNVSWLHFSWATQYIKFDYYDAGIEVVYSLRLWNIIDLTWLDHSHQSATQISDSLTWLKSSNPYADLNLHPKPNGNSNTKLKLGGHTTWRNGKSSMKHFLTNMPAAMTVCFN